MAQRKKSKPALEALPKLRTGINGLDEITSGGLPQGRPTLVCGSAGCGKTLMAMEFLVRGATEFNEPGVFMSFEETGQELTQNVASLGFDLDDLVARKKLTIDYVKVQREEIEETGEFDLDGLFVRLNYAIDSIGAKRVVLDTLETLFTALQNKEILRSELRRLFQWLKQKGVTAIITAERGDGAITRHGFEEYVSDCVIALDHRVNGQISTRRLRIIKYRGSRHGTNEYPFLIDEHGISILPITSIGLTHTATTERISSGIEQLDDMLGGKGFYRGSSILVLGTAGTGKTSLAAHFARATCERGERCLYFAFEESMNQIIRNMRSIGIDLLPLVKKGLLEFHAARPTAYGLEMHLAVMHKVISSFNPSVVVVDPITNFLSVGERGEVEAALMRLIDLMKVGQKTSFFTSLSHQSTGLEQSDVGISSLMDTWIMVRDIESNGERNRGIYILKSRGMAHSNQVREFHLTGKGVQLTDVYIGSGGVMMGSARASQEAKEQAESILRRQEIERKERDLERKRAALDAQVSALRAEFDAEQDELARVIAQDQLREDALLQESVKMASIRNADAQPVGQAAQMNNRKKTIRGNGRGRLK